jgi:iron complex outermembrane recepter protein
MKLRAGRRIVVPTARYVHHISAVILIAASLAGPARASAPPSVKDLSALSLEELANIQVTSVSKRPEPLSQAPAAIYVITNDAIRRSGVTSLPEALRLAPNLHVVRVNSNSYAISARGFNTFEAATKLLVLIDGRSVYTPLHAGVFWDQQQVMVEDIDRIEVISGPGGTLYGANAFNGIINVVTRHSRDTQGGLVSAQIGNIDRTGALRYGGRINEYTTYRGYGRGARMGDTRFTNGTEAEDDWEPRQAGFRSDWQRDQDAVTVQGDFFRNFISGGTRVEGGNILGRWTRTLSETSGLELQGYFDTTERLSPGVTDRLETFDIAGQYNFRLGKAHDIVLGGGFRNSVEEFTNTLNAFVLRPEEDTVRLADLFVQDSIALHDNLTLTLGNKFEHNSHTGLELMPSARLAWRVTDNTLLWSAVSRAVRRPEFWILRTTSNRRLSSPTKPASVRSRQS